MVSISLTGLPIYYRRVSLVERVLLWGFIIPLTLDYRAAEGEGGQFFQWLLLGVTVFSGCFLIVKGDKGKKLKALRPLMRLSTLWWMYIFISVFIALYWEVPIEHYLKTILPFLLCGLSLLVVTKFQINNHSPEEVMKVLIIGSFISVVCRLAYGLLAYNLPIEQVRWRILSPALPIVLSYGLYGLFFLHKFTFKFQIALVLSGIVIILSETRSFIIVICFWALGAYLLVKSSKNLHSNVYIHISRRLPILVIMLSLLLLVVLAMNPDVFLAWEHRLYDNRVEGSIDSDITYLTRVAELMGQWNIVTTDIVSLLFGSGIGNSYEWFIDDYPMLRAALAKVDLERWSTGHNMWGYALFSSGFLFGWIVPFFWIYPLWKGRTTFAGHLTGVAEKPYRTSFVAFTMVWSFLGTTFTSNPFGDRYSGLIVGLAVALVFFHNSKGMEIARSVSN